MIDNEKFIDLITQAKNEQRSGRLYAYTRVDGKLSFATLFINHGQLSGCDYNEKSGDLALSELIDAPITTVVFVAGDGSDDIKDTDIRDIDTLLSSINNQKAYDTQPSFQVAEFKHIATEALKTICGDRATKLVDELAERYPPEKNHHKFIDECVKLASNFVGDKLANNALKSLLAIRN